MQKNSGFLHHNQIFDVISTFFDHDFKKLFMMQKLRKPVGPWSHFKLTYGQGFCTDNVL